jgi:hypothetical protein
VTQFCTFALIYWAFPKDCVHGIEGHFAHALWMSSRTASTIGFNQVSNGAVPPRGGGGGVGAEKSS